MEDRNVHCFDQTLIGPGDRETRPLSGKLESAHCTTGRPYCRALLQAQKSPAGISSTGLVTAWCLCGETQLGVLTVSLCTYRCLNFQQDF